MKLCEVCGVNPAALPDRERQGRPIKRICRECHALRIAGDALKLLELQKKKRDKNG
jgi:hypothetical protein